VRTPHRPDLAGTHAHFLSAAGGRRSETCGSRTIRAPQDRTSPESVEFVRPTHAFTALMPSASRVVTEWDSRARRPVERLPAPGFRPDG